MAFSSVDRLLNIYHEATLTFVAFCTYFVFETRISLGTAYRTVFGLNVATVSDANFLIVFHSSNYESILLSF